MTAGSLMKALTAVFAAVERSGNPMWAVGLGAVPPQSVRTAPEVATVTAHRFS
jgi:hypothetical protein